MLDLLEGADVPAAVLGEFRKGFQVHAALAAVRQERINESCRALKSRLMEGIGQLTHRIDADFYWLAKFKHGANCWSDKDFIADCERKGTIQRVEGKSDKIIVDIGRNGRKSDFGLRNAEVLGAGRPSAGRSPGGIVQ